MLESWVHREGVSRGRSVGREDDLRLKHNVGNSQITDKKFYTWIWRKRKITKKINNYKGFYERKKEIKSVEYKRCLEKPKYSQCCINDRKRMLGTC